MAIASSRASMRQCGKAAKEKYDGLPVRRNPRRTGSPSYLEFTSCDSSRRQRVDNRQAQFFLRAVGFCSWFLRLNGVVELGNLFLAFKEHVVKAIAVVFAIVSCVIPADLWAVFVHAAKIVRLQMVADVVNHQEPSLAIDEQRDFSVDHVPAEVIEIFASHRRFDRQGEVLAALGGAVLAENLTRFEIGSGHFRFGHNKSLLQKNATN